MFCAKCVSRVLSYLQNTNYQSSNALHGRTYTYLRSYTLDDIDYGGFVIFTVTVSLEREKKRKKKLIYLEHLLRIFVKVFAVYLRVEN